MDLDAEWEEWLTRWTLGVHNALEGGVALPLFPMEVAIFRPPEAMGSGCWPLSCADRCIRYPITGYPALVIKPEALRWVSRPAILGGPRRRVGRTAYTTDSRGSQRTWRTCRTAPVSDGGGGFADRNRAGAREWPGNEGTARARTRSSGYHR